MKYRRRMRGLTLTNTLAALTSVGVLAALAVQALQPAREVAHTLECTNKLRQFSLGAQNHHDQRGDNVPMGTFSGGVSWGGLILPYMENFNLYRRLRLDMPYDAVPNNDVRHLKSVIAALPYLYCPARRQAPKYTDGYVAGDYAVPSVGVVETLDEPSLDDTWMQCHSLEKNHGPYLLVHQSQPDQWKPGDKFLDAMRYRSHTSLGSFVDGTSYQVVLGEKALHPDLQGQAGKAGDFTIYAFLENDYSASGPARPGNGGISPSPAVNKDDVYRYWGSWHPDVCLFAMADGGVRRLKAETSNKLLASLCDRRDGADLQLPRDYREPIDDGSLKGE